MINSKPTKEEEIIGNINRAINELVYDKTQLIKAYQYYHGKRDPEQFRHLEENYGIGTPTSVEFVPLVRKHVDVLIGEYLSTPLLPRISCKDKNTLSTINRDKQIAIHSEIAKQLKTHLNNALYNSITQEQNQSQNQGQQAPANDKQIELELQKVQEDLDRNFISNFEIAGQNIVD